MSKRINIRKYIIYFLLLALLLAGTKSHLDSVGQSVFVHMNSAAKLIDSSTLECNTDLWNEQLSSGRNNLTTPKLSSGCGRSSLTLRFSQLVLLSVLILLSGFHKQYFGVMGFHGMRYVKNDLYIIDFIQDLDGSK